MSVRRQMIIKQPQFSVSDVKPGQVVMFAFHRGNRKWSGAYGRFFAGIITDVKPFGLGVTFFSEEENDREHITIMMDELLRGEFSLLNVSLLTQDDINFHEDINPIIFPQMYKDSFAVAPDDEELKA